MRCGSARHVSTVQSRPALPSSQARRRRPWEAASPLASHPSPPSAQCMAKPLHFFSLQFLAPQSSSSAGNPYSCSSQTPPPSHRFPPPLSPLPLSWRHFSAGRSCSCCFGKRSGVRQAGLLGDAIRWTLACSIFKLFFFSLFPSEQCWCCCVPWEIGEMGGRTDWMRAWLFLELCIS